MPALFLQACDDSNELKVIHISGSDCTVNSDATWTSDNLYVVHDSVIIENATLSIEPGTIIKIARNQDGQVIAQPFIVRADTGMIKAAGTAKNHIVFTCYKDDSKGGDTNKDTAVAAKGEWGHLFINTGNDAAVSEFTYCDFYYGGDSNYDMGAMLDVQFASATIDHCTFAHSEHAGLDVMDANDCTTVTNNIFYDNSRPLWMSPDFSIDGSNIFHNSDNTVTNAYNGIWLPNSISISKNRSWGNNGVPFISDGGFSISDGVVLTIATGTVLKFIQLNARVDYTDTGTGYIDNLSNVIFTSYKDDTHGGDTNGDGNNTSPATGDWTGILDNSLNGGAAYGYITGVNILYATVH